MKNLVAKFISGKLNGLLYIWLKPHSHYIATETWMMLLNVATINENGKFSNCKIIMHCIIMIIHVSTVFQI